MNLRHPLLAAAVAAACLQTARAQEVSAEAKVDFKRVEVGSQNTPQIPAPNVKDKRWNPKIWLEIDAGFGLKKGRPAGAPADPSPIVDSIEFKYYVVLSKRDPVSNKPVLLTGTMTYINADSDERELHAMAFASPSALAKATGNPRFTNADITPMSVAIIASKNGVAGVHTSGAGAGKWWDDLSKFHVVDGALLPKLKTPFAPLWGDYDLETSK